MGTNYSFEVKNIEIWVLAFFKHNNSSVRSYRDSGYVLTRGEKRNGHFSYSGHGYNVYWNNEYQGWVEEPNGWTTPLALNQFDAACPIRQNLPGKLEQQSTICWNPLGLFRGDG